MELGNDTKRRIHFNLVEESKEKEARAAEELGALEGAAGKRQRNKRAGKRRAKETRKRGLEAGTTVLQKNAIAAVTAVFLGVVIAWSVFQAGAILAELKYDDSSGEDVLEKRKPF